MSSQIIRMPSIREINPMIPMGKLRQDLLFAFHIVHMLGQPSGMGSHLTARLPGSESFLFHVHNFGFGEVTPDLIHEADFELNVLSGRKRGHQPDPAHPHPYIRRAARYTCILHTHAKHVRVERDRGKHYRFDSRAVRVCLTNAFCSMKTTRRTGQGTGLCHGEGSGRPFLHGFEEPRPSDGSIVDTRRGYPRRYDGKRS